MRMLCWANGHTLMDHVENTEIRKRMKVTELHQNEKRLRWYGHVMRRDQDQVTRRVLLDQVDELYKKRPG